MFGILVETRVITSLAVLLMVVACGGRSPSAPTTIQFPTSTASQTVVRLAIVPLPEMHRGGRPVQATAHFELSDGSHIDVTETKCEPQWSSSAPEIASVTEQGVIEAPGFGEVIIAVACTGLNLRAESTLQVLRPYTISGTAIERYGGSPIPNATATIIDGEDRGTTAVTDIDGRFSFAGLVEPTFELRVTAAEFETDGMRAHASQSEVRVELEPLFRKEVLTITPDGVTRVYDFVFRTHHSGPITLWLHSDCRVPPYSYGERLSNRLAKGSTWNTANHVFGTFLGDGESVQKDDRTDSSAMRVLSPDLYTRQVSMVAYTSPCQWRASVQYPF